MRPGESAAESRCDGSPRHPGAGSCPGVSEQVTAVTVALPDRYQILVVLAAGCGLRQGEAFGLGVDDVDFLRGVIHVRRQVKLVHARQVFAPPKGGKERDVPLPEMVALELAAHLQAFPAVKVTLPWREPEATARDCRSSGHHAGAHSAREDVFQPARLEVGARRRRRSGNAGQWHARATPHIRECAPGGRRVDQSACRIPRPRRSGLHPPDLYPPDAVQRGPRPDGGRSGLRRRKTARTRSECPPEPTVIRGSPEPLRSSVSEISGGLRRPAAGGGVCPVTSADGGPVLTGVVRCDPVVRGPDVAPPWPQRSTSSDPILPFVWSSLL